MHGQQNIKANTDVWEERIAIIFGAYTQTLFGLM
jgi:hypothetical protein